MGNGYSKMVESVSYSLRLLVITNKHSSHVFGTLCSTTDDEQGREPLTADILRAKRTARKERQKAQYPAREGRQAPCCVIFSHTEVVCL